MSRVVDITKLACEYRNHQFVTPSSDRKLINNAIAVPDVLLSEDGRRFPIRAWRPDVTTGSVLVITVEVLVEMEVEDK